MSTMTRDDAAADGVGAMTTSAPPRSVRLLIRFADPEQVGTGAETTFAVADEDGWRIDHPLWWCSTIGYGDTVAAIESDGELVVSAVRRRGQYANARVTFPEGSNPGVLHDLAWSHNAMCEPAGPGRWACAVPAPAADLFAGTVTDAGGTIEWTCGPDTPVGEPRDYIV